MTARQLTLLNQPRARARDKTTSKLAAQAVAPAASELEQAIVACVNGSRYSGRTPITAEGIAELVGFNHPGRWTQGTIVTAVSRCARRGLIEPCGTGLTSRGRSAVTYRRTR